MDGAGTRSTLRWAGVLTAKAIGNGLIAAGIGSAMNHGPGPAIITARGWMTRATVGAGYPPPNGRHPG